MLQHYAYWTLPIHETIQDPKSLTVPDDETNQDSFRSLTLPWHETHQDSIRSLTLTDPMKPIKIVFDQLHCHTINTLRYNPNIPGMKHIKIVLDP
jgi:hypothetical protein